MASGDLHIDRRWLDPFEMLKFLKRPADYNIPGGGGKALIAVPRQEPWRCGSGREDNILIIFRPSSRELSILSYWSS